MTEETIFAAALEKSTPAERAAFLETACAGDAALRRRVEALLASAAEPAFLGSPAVARPADEPGGSLAAPDPLTSAWTDPGTQPGTVLAGRYKLLEPIGEGGMGTVWMAEQTEPVKRRVAVKLIKPGMDSKQVLARFEAERQALALMDHPNIARVLDGGAAADGRPFFVMELVKGVPLTRHCDENRLGVRERLALFADVCRAVQHAHHKGVIHRDLKPSNVLIAPFDGKPVVKVIDFGVAKAAGQQLTDKTLLSNCPEVRLRDPKEALLHAKSGVELLPKEPAMMRVLGIAHFRAGDMPAAVETLEKALALRSGGDAIEWYFLAMAHQKLGRAGTAREFFNRATELMDRSGPPENELVRIRAEAATLLGVREQPPPPRPVPVNSKK